MVEDVDDWVYCFDFSKSLEIENTFYGGFRGRGFQNSRRVWVLGEEGFM